MATKSLCPTQSKMLEQLYNMCLNDGSEIFVLSGSTGSGKTLIIEHLVNNLNEPWSTIYVCGIDTRIRPYQTFYLSNLAFNNKLSFKSISCGISFIPNLAVKFDIGIKNGLFSDAEKIIINSFKKQITTTNVLFVADNYHDWDLASQELLMKIFNSNTLSTKKLKILCTQESIPNKLLKNHVETQNILSQNNLTENDVKHLCNNFESNTNNIDYSFIKNIVNNNIHFLKMYCDYHSLNINSLIDEKLKNVNNEKQLKTFLEALSIIETTFNVNDMSYYDLNIDECVTMELLDESVDISIISGATTYAFTNKIYKEYFISKLKRKKRPLHKKFAQFLRNNYPDDYFDRAKHLILSQNIPHEEAFYFLSIETVRRSFCINEENLDNYIQIIITPMFEELKEIMSPTAYNEANKVAKQYSDAIKLFKQCKLSDAEQSLKSIMLTFLPSHMKAEITRQKLICALHRADDYEKIEIYASELYNIIEHEDFNEDEQWCQATLILFSVYSDRVYDAKRLKNLVEKFVLCVKKHSNVPLFNFMQYAFKRRSAVFYESIPAMRACKESCDFFEEISDINEYYMALNNFAANCLVSNKINDAIQTIKIAISIINTDIYLPSKYKIFVNKMVADFLLEESKLGEVENNRIKEILGDSSNILQGEEQSYLIYFNRLSLNFLLKNLEECEKTTNYLSKLIKNDKFYQYYFNNAMFFLSYFKKNIEHAEYYLEKMKKIDAPLLTLYTKVFAYRHELCEKILKENYIESPHELNKYFQTKRYNEPAWTFYGRAFLLSDIQYLSM